MDGNTLRPSGRGLAWRRAAAGLPVVAVLAAGGPAGPAGAADDQAFGGSGDTYAGVFAGLGRVDGRVVDTDGFSNSGNAGWAVDYGDKGLAAGALVGRRFALGGVPLRVELDGAFGGMYAKTHDIDPRFERRDETVESELRWVVTARAGVEHRVGRATVFATAGLAAARIGNSLTDLDAWRGEDGEWVLLPDNRAAQREDPDDSFHDASMEFGWVIGAGVEAALSDAWGLRLDASYLDFAQSTHQANLSGDDRCCGAGSPRRPVSYRIASKLGVVRLGVIYRFGR